MGLHKTFEQKRRLKFVGKYRRKIKTSIMPCEVNKVYKLYKDKDTGTHNVAFKGEILEAFIGSLDMSYVWEKI